ncbi:MAG: right-handed parallel beta-helix repeat-containing protein [Henriciella sp.]|nr:right-handed parallel beta-helix repeat-containing protein [Henriciella sp.]
MLRHVLVAGAAIAGLVACGPGEQNVDAGDPLAADATPQTMDAATLQALLISVEEGGVVELPEGTIELVDGLSLDVNSVTLRGAGQDKTILDFSGQSGAGEGLLITSDDVIVEGFTMRDTKGDGIKSKGADRITYRDLTVEWSGGPDESNGAYGVYPVESSDVLVERVTVRGASDAGIYVGQSDNIIVRDSLAEFNVAGIEIENSTRADVYNNTVTNNTGGVLVFDLPDLPKIGGHSTRVFGNQIFDNNTRNFAPPGNIVASVPSGTGIIVQANERVEIFDNTLTDNRTAHILLVAYAPEFTDERYNPLPRDIYITQNVYENGGYEPQGDLKMLAMLMGGDLPDIVSDGVNAWPGHEPVDLGLVIDEPETVSYVSLGLGAYPLDPKNLSPTDQRPVSALGERLPTVELSHDK